MTRFTGPLWRVAGSFVSWFVFALSFTLLYLGSAVVMGLGGYCASGGPYVIETECPDAVVAFVPLSIFTGLAAVAVDVLQLHGRESPDRVADVRQRFGRPVMKAVGIAAEADLTQLMRAPGKEDTTTRVYWLQTSNWHADIRAPSDRPVFSDYTGLSALSPQELGALARQQGFAGITEVEGEICRWHRRFDYQPPSGFAGDRVSTG